MTMKLFFSIHSAGLLLPSSAPADPVSVALAYRAALRAHVPEDKLAYGFRKKPLDQPDVKEVKVIPEEILWHSDKPILELKPHNLLHNQKPEETEEEEEEEEELDIAQSGAVAGVDLPGLMPYGDIGYLPEKPREANFNSGLYPAHVYHNLKSGVGCQNPEAHKVGNCGLKLGQIVSIKPKVNEYNSNQDDLLDSSLADRLRRNVQTTKKQ